MVNLKRKYINPASYETFSEIALNKNDFLTAIKVLINFHDYISSAAKS